MATVVHPFLNEGVEARAYQLRSLKKALSASTLMVMPTGFGKTAVEWMVMAEFLRTGAQKIVLIAPTTGLVDQQRRMAQERLNIPNESIIAYTGETAPGKRASLWASATVVMATPQVIRNDAMSGNIDLADVGLLIVDEAHHATGNHAYAQVGNLFIQSQDRARVLAATASPGSNSKHILEVMTRLGTYKLDVAKRDEPLVKPFDVDMEMNLHFLDIPSTLSTLIRPLEAHFTSEVKHLQNLGFLAPKEHVASSDIERAQLRASRAIAQRDVRGYDAARRVADLRRAHMLLNLFRTQGTNVAQRFLDRAEEDGRQDKSKNRFLSLQVTHDLRKALSDVDELHPKSAIVKELLINELTQKPEGKVLVFTEFRDTVAHLLNEFVGEPLIRAAQFIGQSTRGKQKGMTQKQQLAQLQRFREGEINVLVATSVGEEGLDVPAADLVILYEPVPSAIRAIQRRGRTARQRAGAVHVLITKDTRDMYVHTASQHQERNMYRILEGNTIQRKVYHVKDRDDALEAFSVQSEEGLQSAQEFLDSALDDAKLQIQEEKISKETPEGLSKAQPRLAPRLTPAEMRPKHQTALDSFMPGSTEQSEALISQTQDAIDVVLNASLQEIEELNALKGNQDLILIDHREANSTLPAYLKGLGFKTQLTRLPYGDLRLSDRILIERKTARDLLASIKNGRLLRQARALKASATRPLLLIETGNERELALHPNAVLGALAHVSLDLGIPVMMTKNAEESAHFIAVAARREHDLLERFQQELSATQKQDEALHQALRSAAIEVQNIQGNSQLNHPWLDDMKEHLGRCFAFALGAIKDLSEEERDIMNAFSPSFGALMSASETKIKQTAECSEELAKIVHERLRQT